MATCHVTRTPVKLIVLICMLYYEGHFQSQNLVS